MIVVVLEDMSNQFYEFSRGSVEDVDLISSYKDTKTIEVIEFSAVIELDVDVSLLDTLKERRQATLSRRTRRELRRRKKREETPSTSRKLAQEAPEETSFLFSSSRM